MWLGGLTVGACAAGSGLSAGEGCWPFGRLGGIGFGRQGLALADADAGGGVGRAALFGRGVIVSCTGDVLRVDGQIRDFGGTAALRSFAFQVEMSFFVNRRSSFAKRS